MKNIFVQIASYRDPELVPTIKNLLEESYNSDRLHICIAFQYKKEDSFTKDLDVYRNDSRFTILDIPYTESKGACWARNMIQQHYKGEDYTLQIDSHHRFVKNWDEELINMIEKLQENGHDKPLITTYLPPYNPNNDPLDRVMSPTGMSFDRFTPEGVVFFIPYYLSDTIDSPISARFFSAHFVFTLGQHCLEVKHDPSFYFHGEEITLAVRSFTWGYDLFHPNKLIAWHEYTRNNRVKHWDDDPNWTDKNNYTFIKVRQLLGVDKTPCTPCNIKQFGEYYLGEKRTIQDWENQMGIRFSDRSIQQSVKDNKEPKQRDEPYFTVHKYLIEFSKSKLYHNDYEWFAIIFEDEEGNQLYRRDEQDVNLLTEETVSFWQEYQGTKPYKWIVWPYSKEKGWVDKIEEIV